MINATSFTYNGVASSQYNVGIATFDNSVQTTLYGFTRNVNAVKTRRAKKFYNAGAYIETPPTITFSITKFENAQINQKEILQWLYADGEYHSLVFTDGDFAGESINCVATDVQIQYFNGVFVGVVATFSCESLFTVPDSVSNEV